MLKSILSFSALACITIASSLPSDAKVQRGCQPKTDPDGCALIGAPLVSMNSKAYLIVTRGHVEGKGEFGYADTSIRVGDITSQQPQAKKSSDFPIAVTYVNSEFSSLYGSTIAVTEKKSDKPVHRGGTRRVSASTKCNEDTRPVCKKQYCPPDCGMPESDHGSGTRLS